MYFCVSAIPQDESHHYSQLGSCVRGKKNRRFKFMFWHITCYLAYAKQYYLQNGNADVLIWRFWLSSKPYHGNGWYINHGVNWVSSSHLGVLPHWLVYNFVFILAASMAFCFEGLLGFASSVLLVQLLCTVLLYIIHICL